MNKYRYMLNFREYLINEVLGNFSYDLPDDKEQQIYDFYILSQLVTQSGIGNIRPEDRKPIVGDAELKDKLKYYIEEAVKSLYPVLKRNLLKAVMFSLCAELRHVFERNTLEELYQLIGDKLGENYLKIFKRYAKNTVLMKDDFGKKLVRKNDRAERLPKGEGNNNWGRKISFNAAMNAGKPEEWAKIMEVLYNNAKWVESYGGSAWGKIATGWLHLYGAEELKEQMIWIDHIYDLQHNTGTVFNKLDAYSKDGGYDWLKRALDYKANAKHPIELIKKASPRMRRLALPAFKAFTGKTLEDFPGEKEKEKERLKLVLPNQGKLVSSTKEKEEFEGLFDPKDLETKIDPTPDMVTSDPKDLETKIDPTPDMVTSDPNQWIDSESDMGDQWIKTNFRYYNKMYKDLEDIGDSIKLARIFLNIGNFVSAGTKLKLIEKISKENNIKFDLDELKKSISEEAIIIKYFKSLSPGSSLGTNLKGAAFPLKMSNSNIEVLKKYIKNGAYNAAIGFLKSATGYTAAAIDGILNHFEANLPPSNQQSSFMPTKFDENHYKNVYDKADGTHVIKSARMYNMLIKNGLQESQIYQILEKLIPVFDKQQIVSFADSEHLIEEFWSNPAFKFPTMITEKDILPIMKTIKRFAKGQKIHPSLSPFNAGKMMKIIKERPILEAIKEFRTLVLWGLPASKNWVIYTKALEISGLTT